MKNKLKMLLAYFRALGGGNYYTSITMGYNRIEDWDEGFTSVWVDSNSTSRSVKPPKVIIDIVEELLEIYQRDFDWYNNYSTDDWWYLDMMVYPKENKILFTSECKYEHSTNRDFEGKVDDYRDVEEILNKIKESYGEFTKIMIAFEGRWDDGRVNNIWIDGRAVEESDFPRVSFWDIVNPIMKWETNIYWNSEYGMSGDITIWGDDVIGDIEEFYEEMESTEMNLEVTPDNVKEK